MQSLVDAGRASISPAICMNRYSRPAGTRRTVGDRRRTPCTPRRRRLGVAALSFATRRRSLNSKPAGDPAFDLEAPNDLPRARRGDSPGCRTRAREIGRRAAWHGSAAAFSPLVLRESCGPRPARCDGAANRRPASRTTGRTPWGAATLTACGRGLVGLILVEDAEQHRRQRVVPGLEPVDLTDQRLDLG